MWAWIKTQQDSATVTENVHSLKGDRCQLWREGSGCRAILEHSLADLWHFLVSVWEHFVLLYFWAGVRYKGRNRSGEAHHCQTPSYPQSLQKDLSGKAPTQLLSFCREPCLFPLWSLTFWNTVNSWTTFLEWPLSLK